MPPSLPSGLQNTPSDIAARAFSMPKPGPGPYAMLPKVLNIPLPWLEPFPDAQFFNVSANKSTSVGETGISITGSKSQIGQGVIGVLRSFTVNINDMTPATNVVFTLMVNGGPVPGFGQISMFPRNAASVSNSFDCMIILPVSATIEVFYNNADGGSYLVGASYGGWQYPEASARRWMMTGPMDV